MLTFAIMLRYFTLIYVIVLCASEDVYTDTDQEFLEPRYWDACIADQTAIQDFRASFNAFTIQLYKRAANQETFFVLSPHAVWLTLAAIAEGSDRTTQEELFEVLNLPQDSCTRLKWYRIASSRIIPTKFMTIIHRRRYIIDENSRINPHWYSLVNHNSLLQTILLPLKRDPDALSEVIKRLNPVKYGISISRNPLLVNCMEYNGLWNTAFSESLIERAPFYNEAGEQIGSVDLMKMKKKVRMGFVENINSNVLELPIGLDGKYSMLFAVGVNNESNVGNLNNNTMFEVVAALRYSNVPVEIGIPRLVISSVIDVKKLLEDMGVVHLWNDPKATRYISTPPAQPKNYIQRATLTLNNAGVNPPPPEYLPHPYPSNGPRFIANKPFMFGLFDTETYTCLLSSLYTEPTYRY